eukprot:2891593-Amphidinium_carterae.1
MAPKLEILASAWSELPDAAVGLSDNGLGITQWLAANNVINAALTYYGRTVICLRHRAAKIVSALSLQRKLPGITSVDSIGVDSASVMGVAPDLA